jgi:LuxR family maltose regulon positive regulatory protein
MMIPKVLLTKITPPRSTARILTRTRISQLLAESLHYRLTLLQAGAGFGKSTALVDLVHLPHPVIWYQITEEDNDPFVFLLHLCHATRHTFPELHGLPLERLESWDGTRGPLPALEITHQFINTLSEKLSSPTLMILDDIHLVDDVSEIAMILDNVISLAPSLLHILIATRPIFQLPSLSRWQTHGEVFTIDQSFLKFTIDEILELFTQQYGYPLTAEDAEMLYNATEGWAIALQLIWQSLRSGVTTSIEDALTRQTTSLDSLFELLAHDVLGHQPKDVQDFLSISATLRVMTPEACDALRETKDSAAMLAYLRRQELFVVDLDQAGLRYHHILHRLLRQRSTEEQRENWHSRAAEFYLTHQDPDSAIYHLLQSQNFDGAAELLETHGTQLFERGRLDTLAIYLDAIPPGTLHKYPFLLSHHGDCARLRSRFQEALGWYQQAEALWRERGNVGRIAKALRDQARVYLDTVNPSRAEQLLQRSLRLSDGTADREAQARMYELLAENKLNAGKASDAERFRQQAKVLRREGPADSQLLFRVLLRTGRLQEARQQLEVRAEVERQEPVHTPRAHRETLLLLSLIYALQGEAHKAHQAAVEGTSRGIELESPFVRAVGHMRQGHALMLLPGEDRYRQARQQFENAIEISHTLAIPRLRVEAFWGLCRSYGYQGDLVKAQQVAQSGIDIASQAGDEWIASLIRLTMGASLCLSGRYEISLHWLSRATHGFQQCSDPFGFNVARLWHCLGLFWQEEMDLLAQEFPEVLATCRKLAYDFLFVQPTLLGCPDERMLVPLLIQARDSCWETNYCSRLLHMINLPHITLHPGYQLRVYTLGGFQTWLGDQAVPPKGWHREKARQLFQLLITYRHAPLDRDQILEFLWPNANPSIAQRNFKVALSTLYNVLEPNRQPGSDSAFVLREGTVYGIRPSSDLWLDAEEFIHSFHEAEDLMEQDSDQAIRLLQSCMDLHQGEYLPDTRYDGWAAAEREHIATLFLQAADRLCCLLLRRDASSEVIDLCHRILQYDSCWERAYRHLMLAYDQLGDHGQIARVYQRCVQVMQEELDISPSPETTALYEKLTCHS